MKAPDRIKIGTKEYVREDLLMIKTEKSLEVKKVAKIIIPKELWQPIHKKLEGKKKELSELRKILRDGESEALMDFARDNDLDYDALRKIMSLVNPGLHTSETLEEILGKAVKALKDAGVVKPLDINQKQLWCFIDLAMKDSKYN